VAQVDDFHSMGLQNAPHDIDGCIMAIEKRGGRDHADRILRLVDHEKTGLVQCKLQRFNAAGPAHKREEKI
jgi:hypothetical protein